jgi:hypothetical protein
VEKLEKKRRCLQGQDLRSESGPDSALLAVVRLMLRTRRHGETEPRRGGPVVAVSSVGSDVAKCGARDSG